MPAKKNPPPRKGAKPVDALLRRDDDAPVEQRIADAIARSYDERDPSKCFAHFSPLAAAVATDALPAFKGNALVMLANVTDALTVLTPALPRVVAELRQPRLREVFELPSLTLGLHFAATRVPTTKLSSGEIDQKLAEGAPLRALTLSYLEVVSSPALNLVPAERVRAIREGSGKLDRAEDFVAIPGLFREFEATLAGRHPFTAQSLARLGELGAELLQQMRPGSAPKATAVRTPESVLRDQFAALVAERYDHLLVLAAVAFGKARADELLPALRSTAASAPANATAPVTPPAPVDPPRPV